MKIVASIIVIGASNFTFHPPAVYSMIACSFYPRIRSQGRLSAEVETFSPTGAPFPDLLGLGFSFRMLWQVRAAKLGNRAPLFALFPFLQSFMRFASSMPGSLDSMLLAFAPACPLLAHVKVVGVVILFRERTSRG